MATSLTATTLPDLAAVRLRLEAAPDAPLVMVEMAEDPAARDLEAARWSVTGTGLTKSTSPAAPYRVRFVYDELPGGTATTSYASRSLPGLTIGTRYRVSLSAGSAWWQLSLGVLGIGSKTVYAARSAAIDYTLDGWWTYEFTATATTHELRVAVTATISGPGGTWELDALRVEKIPAALVRLETDFPKDTEAAAWTFAGLPVGAGSTSFGSGDLIVNPTWKPKIYRSSGTPDVNGASVRRTVTGLTVGKTYTARLAVQCNAVVNNAPASTRSSLGVVGLGATAPAPWGGAARWVSYTFTATATSHVLAVSVAEPLVFTTGSDYVEWEFDYLRVEELVVNTATLVALTRADVNGTRPVRLYAAQGLSGGTLVISDYEAALTGLVTYTGITSTSGVQESASASVSDVGTDATVLAPANLPQYLTPVPLITGVEGSRTAQTTVHDVVGRPDPLVVLGPLGTRRGMLDIFVDEYVTGLALLSVYERGEVVLLRQPDVPGLDMYHVAMRASLGRDQTRWKLAVEYVEVNAPTGPLLGALGWTFDQASASYPTFAAARAAFPAFADYTAGPL